MVQKSLTVTLLGLILLSFPSLVICQDEIIPTVSDDESSDGAKTLWVALVNQIESDYFELDQSGEDVQWTEAKITEAVSELLSERARKNGIAIRKLSKLDDLRNVGEVREEFYKFVEVLRLRDGGKYAMSRYVEAGIDLFCKKHLVFSQYWSRQFWRKRVEFEDDPDRNARPDFAVKQLADNALRCFPFPESEAQKRGIRDGDELISFDGEHVERMSLSEFASRFLGAADSKIQVGVRQTSGRILSVSLTRSSFGRAVTAEPYRYSTIYRIPQLSRETAGEVRSFLEKAKPSNVILDLRGNGGGPLNALPDLIGLFVGGERPLTVGRIFRREDTLERELTTEEVQLEGIESVTLLVDEGTASTAEFFVQALRDAEDGPRVVISGDKTYGKDVWLNVTPFEGGGALALPKGRMKTIQGGTWKNGIVPTLNLKN